LNPPRECAHVTLRNPQHGLLEAGLKYSPRVFTKTDLPANAGIQRDSEKIVPYLLESRPVSE
jgi:hypothetical protein